MPLLFYKIAAWFRRLWKWIRAHWKWVVGGIVVLFLTILIYRAVSKGKAGELQAEIMGHQIKVITAEREVARLEGQRDIIRKQTVDVVARIQQLDLQLASLNTRIAVSRSEIDRLTAAEKVRKFQELGY
jgi:uncharacterized protein YhaN